MKREVLLAVLLWFGLIAVECMVVHEDDDTDSDIAFIEKRTKVKDKTVTKNYTHSNEVGETLPATAESVATSRLELITKVVKDLKTVLNKRTMPTQAKSSILNQVFDAANDDPKKIDLAKEIFRKVLEPAKPTNGAVGDLGAEMIKVSVVSRRHFNTTRSSNMLRKKKRRRHRRRRKRKLKSVSLHPKNVMQQNKTEYKPSPKTKPFQKSTTPRFGNTKYIHNTAKLKRNTYKLKNMTSTLLNILARKGKYFKYELQPSTENKSLHEGQYHLVKVKNNPGFDMRGKTAKLLSLKIRSPKHLTTPTVTNGTNTSISRKDLVIELDDSNSDENNENGARRQFDPIMSLISRLTRSNSGDVAVFDERDDDDRESNDYDDGFISQKRRRIGENLFLNSFSEENDDDDAYDDNENEDNRFENVENNLSDLYEPQLARQLAPYTNDGRDASLENPDIYEQQVGGEENFFNNIPTNAYDPEKPVLMEIDNK